MCEIIYNREKEEYTIGRLPELMLDIIIDHMFSDAAYSWIGEILADEKATAEAVAQEKAEAEAEAEAAEEEAARRKRQAARLTHTEIAIKNTVEGGRTQ